MTKRDQKGKFTFDFDEQGTNEVSEQIMNSYNSGFIGQDEAESGSDRYVGTEDQVCINLIQERLASLTGGLFIYMYLSKKISARGAITQESIFLCAYSLVCNVMKYEEE